MYFSDFEKIRGSTHLFTLQIKIVFLAYPVYIPHFYCFCDSVKKKEKIIRCGAMKF